MVPPTREGGAQGVGGLKYKCGAAAIGRLGQLSGVLRKNPLYNRALSQKKTLESIEFTKCRHP